MKLVYTYEFTQLNQLQARPSYCAGLVSSQEDSHTDFGHWMEKTYNERL
jgi:hypothetical protein